MRIFYTKLLTLIFPRELKLIRYKISICKEDVENELGYAKNLITILIIGEDRRFGWHIGFDIIAILRAIRNNIFYKKREGASTIEQQLIRTILEEYQITFRRKLKEILLSVCVRSFIDKKYIPLVYLEMAYFGENIYGYKNIAKYLKLDKEYFDKLNAAKIIARLKYPESVNDETQLKIENRINYLIKKYDKV